MEADKMPSQMWITMRRAMGRPSCHLLVHRFQAEFASTAEPKTKWGSPEWREERGCAPRGRPARIQPGVSTVGIESGSVISSSSTSPTSPGASDIGYVSFIREILYAPSHR